jgi:hypothetical protein
MAIFGFSGGFGIKLKVMSEAVEKIAKILGVKPEVLVNLNREIAENSDSFDVFEKIISANDERITETLTRLGIQREGGFEKIIERLNQNVSQLDIFLGKIIGGDGYQRLVQTAFKLNRPASGLFIKKEKGRELLEKFPPGNVLDFFGANSVSELLASQDFDSVFCSLRFTQDGQWMKNFFDQAYSQLSADDFEEREVKILILDPKWAELAKKFTKKKLHNISHLKEWGIIFIIPTDLKVPGQKLRTLLLLLHYLNEVPYYSRLFRNFLTNPDFTNQLKSLLRGDVPDGQVPSGGTSIRIVQRYLAKDDENDFRLFEPHVNPEAEHWLKAMEDLAEADKILGWGENLGLKQFSDLNCAADFFLDRAGGEKLVSFDLIDQAMSLVNQNEVKYLYHQREALWNEIFAGFWGRDKMNRLIEENIVEGFISF